MDNASNNDTCMKALERELRQHNIPFNAGDRRIRYVKISPKITEKPQLYSSNILSCFPHVVNLACKAVLEAITNLKFAAENSADIQPDSYVQPETFLQAMQRDPIALLRALIRGVCAT